MRLILGLVAVATLADAAPSVGPARAVAPEAREGQLRLRLAAGTSGFLAVWQAGVGTASRVRAARLRLDGTSVDPAGIDVAGGDQGHLEPAVAFGHGVYLVGWTVMRAGRSRVEVISIGEDGSVAAGGPVAVSAEQGHQRSIDLVATAEGFLATFSQYEAALRGHTVRVVALDAAGRPTAAPPLQVTTATPWTQGEDFVHGRLSVAEAQQPRLLAQGSTALVTWTGSGPTSPATNGRPFVAPLDLERWVAGQPAPVSPEAHSRVWTSVVAADGDAALFSWTDHQDRGQSGPPSGNAIRRERDGGTSPVRLGPRTVRQVRVPALSGTGLVAFADLVRINTDDSWYLESHLVLREVGAPDEPDVVVDTHGTWPAFAVHASGVTVLAWTRVNQAAGNAVASVAVVSR